MKIQKLALSLIVATALPFAAHAQEGTDTAASSTAKKSDANVSDLKDIDQEITNAKLRAESGSKKKFSFRSYFSYNGSTIQKPMAKERPNFTGATANDPDTSLSGQFGMKYRASDRGSVSLQTGLSVRRPFGGPLYNAQRDEVNKSEIANPTLSYDYVTKLGEFQSITSVGADYGTSRFRTQTIHLISNINLGQTFMYSFKSGWELGGILDLNANVYTPEQDLATTLYDGGLYAMLEYAFNDKYSFRTVFRYWTFESSRENPNTYDRIYGSQSIGVGMALARDFYLYPNLQFAPQNLRADVTNWGISANINL